MIYFGDGLRLRAGLVPLWKLWSHNHLQFCNKVYLLIATALLGILAQADADFKSFL